MRPLLADSVEKEPPLACVENLVKCTHYLTRSEDVAAYGTVRSRHLGNARPASIFVVVTALARPTILLEVEAVAAKA